MGPDLQSVLSQASDNDETWSLLQASPSSIFLGDRSVVDPLLADQFDQHFLKEVYPLLTRDAATQWMQFPSAGCASCKTASFLVAAGIVAVGVAGLAALGTGSAIVIQLASFAGVSTPVALAFIVSLGATIAGGVSNVVNAICDWTGAC